jgi:thioesterase domain-containing protein/acyl carrier protein
VKPDGRYERVVAELWRRLLQREDIGRDDGWFDLGGDSLGAIEMLAELETVLSIPLPPSLIAEASTVAELAARAQGSLESADGRVRARCIELNRGEPGRSTVVLLPGLLGAGLAYRLLVSETDPSRPIVTVDAHGLAAGERPLRSMAAMATRVAERIDENVRWGPIAPGGGSFGGLLAWELARQLLERRGEEAVEVPLVVLVDTYAPSLAARHSPAMRASAAESSAVRARRAGSNLARSMGFRGGFESLSMRQRQRRLRAQSLRAAARYDIAELPVRALVFASADRRRICGRDDLGWSDLARGGVVVAPLDGGHPDIFSHPAIGIVGATIERELAAADRLRGVTQG